MKTSNRIIVAFHIGRGGNFNNAGHKSYLGEKNFQDLISLNSNNIFLKDRDYKTQRFCKNILVDSNGNGVTYDNIKGLTGKLYFDGQYDTDIARYIEDCDQEELQIIQKSDEYKSYELQSRLAELIEE